MMRGSGWFLPLITIGAWLATIAWPAVAIIETIWSTQRSDVEIRSAGSLLVTSVGWAISVSIVAALLGWAPGRMLGRAVGRGFIVLAALLLIPICLPSYVIFYAWWQSWPAESEIYRWIVNRQLMQVARQATLFIGLVCWSWPLVSLCVAGVVASTPKHREELMLLDGAGLLRRIADRIRLDGHGLVLGASLVFLATLANTTCFDLAEVFTFSNELRAMQALGANAADVVVASLPAIFISLVGAIIVWWVLGQPMRDRATGAYHAGGAAQVLTGCVWGASLMVPLGLLIWNISQRASSRAALGDFFTLYSWSAANTVMYAAISAGIGAAIAVGMSAMWHDHRRPVRTAATLMSCTWLVAALLPGTLLGAALQAGYNRGWLMKNIYLTPGILVIAHLTCFGFVAALFSRWIVRREPQQISELRTLDGAHQLTSFVWSAWPRLLTAGFAAAVAIFVLAIGEIPVTALVHPPHRPGAGPLALSMLNDMHYQRPEPVMVTALAMLVLGALAAFTLAAVWRLTMHRAHVRSATALLCVGCVGVVLSGCEPDDPDNVPPLKPRQIFGAAGSALGQFAYPRAIDVDPARELLYIVDKGARVQRFGFDGKPQAQWEMPESANGKPTGVSVAPSGLIYVADTHYFRVIAYDSEGQEKMRFGAFGRGPGQFIYVTDVAFGPDNRLYVSEYGGNDRVQVFDSQGTYLFEFGKFGEGHGSLNRPQSLAFNFEKTELYIADACNHRIVVVDVHGNFLRSFGTPGRGVGELTYPYGLAVLNDGSLLIAEFGNNRLQQFDPQGKFMGLYGNIGRGPGQLQYPWGVAAAGDRVFVLDSGNNRVQVIRTP